ncbi:hypothetical protein RUM43_015097 [Polyplax serrata]|uniref:Uncharacterized protein n=1 Tax=Polyplax serrata TaxID=468196 RepID=A0AAN8RRU8_POLSC
MHETTNASPAQFPKLANGGTHSFWNLGPMFIAPMKGLPPCQPPPYPPPPTTSCYSQYPDVVGHPHTHRTHRGPIHLGSQFMGKPWVEAGYCGPVHRKAFWVWNR